MQINTKIDPTTSRFSRAPSFFTSALPKARKVHTCGECHEKIKIGERYEYINGYWDGDFYIFKSCALCAELRNKFFWSGRSDDGYLWEFLGEHFDESAYPGTIKMCDLKGLTPAAQQKLINKIIDI